MGSQVLETCRDVANCAKLVRIDRKRLKEEVKDNISMYSRNCVPQDWQQSYHFISKDSELTLRYILVLDALNFCFWTVEGYEYHHLASSIRFVAETDPSALSPQSLSELSSETLFHWLTREFQGDEWSSLFMDQMKERARFVREVGKGLLDHFDGSAVNMVLASEKSAIRMVELVISTFKGFQDHSVYNGRQVFFYKRAQILVGDIWGAFKGQSYGEFTDMHFLTCFADYRIPQLLYSLNILVYSPELESKVLNKQIITQGTDEEIEIRALTVVAVDLLQKECAALGNPLLSVEMDWILWERGESMLPSLPPHHRTLTVYY